MHETVIESESMVAVETINNPKAYFGLDVSIFECSQLAMDFTSVSYVHFSRDANHVADSLARHSFSLNSSQFWDSDTLDFILQKIVNDMAII